MNVPFIDIYEQESKKMNAATNILLTGKVQINTVSAEIGYGTSSVVFNEGDKMFSTITFPSLPIKLKNTKDLSGGLFDGAVQKSNVLVSHNDMKFEVGPNICSTSGRMTTRVLNDNYVQSEQYQVLLKGALLLQPHNKIDCLALGLPVNRLGLKEELEQSISKLSFEDRCFQIKNIWIIAQPFAALLHHVEQKSENGLSFLKGKSYLTLDIGYLTFDYIVTNGMHINSEMSGACDLGMSVLIREITEHLKTTFSLNDLNSELINQAFELGKLKLFGKEYSFPKHEGGDVSFDVMPLITKHMQRAVNEVINIVGQGEQLSGIVICGGASSYLEPVVKNAFKFLETDTYGIDAVAKGLQYGAILKSLKAKN